MGQEGIGEADRGRCVTAASNETFWSTMVLLFFMFKLSINLDNAILLVSYFFRRGYGLFVCDCRKRKYKIAGYAMMFLIFLDKLKGL